MADKKPLANYSGTLKEIATGDTIALANGGTGAVLTDPNADRIMFWDDSAGAVTWLEAGSGLSISGTTITASSSGGGVGSVKTVYKSSNETVASNTTVQDDNELLFAIGASEVWHVLILAKTGANISGGIKIDFGVPASATGNFIASYDNVSQFALTGTIGTPVGGTNVMSSHEYFVIIAKITNSTNAGNVVFKWAQNASNVNNTTVFAGSLLIAMRVS